MLFICTVIWSTWVQDIILWKNEGRTWVIPIDQNIIKSLDLSIHCQNSQSKGYTKSLLCNSYNPCGVFFGFLGGVEWPWQVLTDINPKKCIRPYLFNLCPIWSGFWCYPVAGLIISTTILGFCWCSRLSYCFCTMAMCNVNCCWDCIISLYISL